MFVDDNDEAPGKLSEHFRSVLLQMRNKTWRHFLPEKLKPLKQFQQQSLEQFRGFDLDPGAVWLGPRLLSRAVNSLFDSIRRLYHQYSTHRVTPHVTLHFGPSFAAGSSSLRNSLQSSFPALAPKPRGRKRKKPGADADSDDVEVIDDILLQGATRSRVVAILCKWQGHPASECSWQPLHDQPEDLVEWWSEEVEARYPLLHPSDYQVPLQLHRNGAFSRG